MTALTDIPRFLSLLSRNADVIEATYHDQSVLKTEENEAAIRLLHKERVLSPREDGHYGLTRALRDVLDDLTQRQKRFAIKGNIGEEIDRMEKLLTELEAAAVEGRHEDIDRNSADLIQSLYDVRELIDADLLQFDQVMTSRFSDVKTIDEKMRQNQHYLDRADRLRKALNRLNRTEAHERFSRRDISSAGHVYQNVISGRMEAWTTSLLEISDVFASYMFSFREIETHTRKIRAFAKFLNEGGEPDLEQIALDRPLCNALMRKPPPGAKGWLDIYSERGRRTLAVYCEDLKPIEERTKTEREAGQRVILDSEPKTDDIVAAEELALTYLLNHVDKAGDWVSVHAWSAERDDIRPEVFMEQVISWITTEEDEQLYQIVFDLDAGLSPKTANQRLEDIRLCRAA
ncbi:hypothetical protein [Tateyamaria pelophila]|uniref:hypothetical protein n=1 Tax=Tateyamaria pelophila TaxID=328415 RepID=UPI001CBEF642|nr:hypothetical protein [Tateyamaria pelophila]